MRESPFAIHEHILARWVESLTRIPAVQVVWLTGSLVDGRGDHGSDIDLRLGIADADYAHLWETDHAPLLAGLGEHYLLLNADFVRALTREGILVELAAVPVSTLADKEVYEWRLLLNRLPHGEPTFRTPRDAAPADTWPANPATVEDVRGWTTRMLHLMATAAPSAFYEQEWLSGGYLLDFLRNQLIQIMYQRLGIQFAKRIKHLSRVLPADYQADLASTYPLAGESSLAPHALASTILRTLQIIRRHLVSLSEAAGGGFEAAWFDRIYQQTEHALTPWRSA